MEIFQKSSLELAGSPALWGIVIIIINVYVLMKEGKNLKKKKKVFVLLTWPPKIYTPKKAPRQLMTLLKIIRNKLDCLLPI